MLLLFILSAVTN